MIDTIQTAFKTGDFSSVAEHYLWLIIVVAVWSLFWKGWALWESGRRTQKAWFIVLLVVNSLGILEIIYLLGFKRRIQY